MKYEIKDDFKGFTALGNSETILNRIFQILERNIKMDTQMFSKDPAGKPFKEYSKQYLKHRLKNGRSKIPDLTFTGKMLNTILKVNQSNKSIEVGYIPGGKDHQKAAFVSGLRDFLGVSELSDKQIEKAVDDYITEELEKNL